MKDNKITRHHICPRSRGGTSEKDNLTAVTHYEHDLYHRIFSNKTPTEILHYLITVFWKGKKQYLIEYLEELEDD